ncbi:MAG TPA: hypothetical protein VFE98_00355 [Candidatus Bathyarchaeia archaeon]|nr:hypothetical protein [Candidatus Bathyarchaeia archaeon]
MQLDRSPEPEQILGEIPVVTRLAIGSERLRLLITTSRILIVHIGKRGAGALATSSLFGKLSGVVEDALKTGRESLRQSAKRRLVPSDVLAADKDNFPLSYNDIVSVDITDLGLLVSLTILSKDDKFQFRTQMKYELIVELFEKTLSSKIRTRRL